MAEEETKVKIGGDVSEGLDAVKEFSESVAQMFDGLLKGSVENFLGTISKIPIGVIAAVGAVAALTNVAREATAETAKMVSENINLSDRLGMTVARVQALQDALADVGVSTETYTGASTRLSRQVKQNEDQVNQMGVATRDASGHLLDNEQIMRNAIDALAEYKAGQDRTEAGMAIFGARASEVNQLLRLTSEAIDEAEAKQRALGLTITEEGVERFKEYRKAQRDVQDVMEAFTNVIGQAMMPVLTRAAEWFGSIGPQAVEVLRGAMYGLVAIFETFKLLLNEVIDLFKIIFDIASVGAANLFSALSKAASGDFKGAWKDIVDSYENVPRAFQKGGEEMVADAENYSKNIMQAYNQAYGKETPAGRQGPQGTKNFTPPETKDEKKQALETEIKEEIDAAKLKAQIMIDDVELQRKLADEGVKNETLTKAQRIELEKDFSTQIAQIRMGLAYAEQVAYEKDPMHPEKARAAAAQMEVIARKQTNTMILLSSQVASESAKYWKTFSDDVSGSLTNTWTRGLQMMLRGTLSFRDALKGLFTSIVGAFTDAIAKMVVEWIIGENLKTAIAQGASFLRKLIFGEEAVAEVSTKASTVAPVLAAEGAKGAAGAASSQASIPYVGPYLAVAAAVSMLGFILGLSSMASAEGGYDIPAGVNPVTQLHQNEMVLPAQYADVIRGMAQGGGQGGGGGMNIHIHAMDSQDVSRALMKGGALYRVMRNMQRNAVGG